MIDIIVAILCNLVPAFILICGIISGIKSGIRISILNLISVLSAGVLAYFACPLISNKLTSLSIAINESSIYILDILKVNGVSIGTINSVIYLISFVIIYLFGLLFCNLIKNTFILNKLKDKTENKARLKRAKSINPKAERIAKKTMVKALKVKFDNSLNWWNRLISTLIYIVASLLIGFIVLIPYKFIASDLVAIDSNKQYLLNGYNYTINGLIEKHISFDIDGWLINAIDKGEETPEEPPVETPCEHIYAEGVCTLCGEAEPIEVPCEHSYVEGVCEHCGEEETIVTPPVEDDNTNGSENEEEITPPVNEGEGDGEGNVGETPDTTEENPSEETSTQN